MEQETLFKKFTELGESQVIDVLTDQLQLLSRQMGKKLTDDDLVFIVQQLKWALKRRYVNWMVKDFLQCLEHGKIGNYHAPGSSTSLTVASIESWMFKHNARVQSQIIDEQIRDATMRRNDTATAFAKNANPLMAEAVLWRLNTLQSIKSTYGRNAMQNKQYLQKKDAVFAIPFETIVNAIKNNTTHTLTQYL